MQAMKKIEEMEYRKKMNIIIKNNLKKRNEESTDDRIFIHFKFHPQDISRNKIQSNFNNTCLEKKNGKASLRKIIGELWGRRHTPN